MGKARSINDERLFGASDDFRSSMKSFFESPVCNWLSHVSGFIRNLTCALRQRRVPEHTEGHRVGNGPFSEAKRVVKKIMIFQRDMRQRVRGKMDQQP